MKIVVTGGSGLVGQQVIRELLAHGHQVLSLDRRPHPAGHKRSWAVDLMDSGVLYEAFRDADAVIHLAAHMAPDLTSDCATFSENVTTTYNVFKAAHDLNVRRVVFASSLAALGFLYGPGELTPHYLPADEDHPLIATDPYGLSKTVGEQIAASFARRGMTIVSLRLPGVNFDPSFARLLTLMADPARRRSGFWSYVDVRDAAVAIRLSVDAPVKGHRIFNIAASTSSMREPTLELIAQHFPDLKDIRSDAPGNWSGVSSARAARELGFAAEHTWEHFVAGHP